MQHLCSLELNNLDYLKLEAAYIVKQVQYHIRCTSVWTNTLIASVPCHEERSCHDGKCTAIGNVFDLVKGLSGLSNFKSS